MQPAIRAGDDSSQRGHAGGEQTAEGRLFRLQRAHVLCPQNRYMRQIRAGLDLIDSDRFQLRPQARRS